MTSQDNSTGFTVEIERLVAFCELKRRLRSATQSTNILMLYFVIHGGRALTGENRGKHGVDEGG